MAYGIGANTCVAIWQKSDQHKSLSFHWDCFYYFFTFPYSEKGHEHLQIKNETVFCLHWELMDWIFWRRTSHLHFLTCIFFFFSHCVSISNDPTKPLLALTRHVDGQECHIYRNENKKKKCQTNEKGSIEKPIFPTLVKQNFSTFFHSCSNKEFTGLSWWHYY